MSLRIELLEPEPGHFTVVVGDRFADHLMRDEALAVVAGALFCNTHEPPFLKTYEQWARWDQRYRQPEGQPFKPHAIITWRGAGVSQ